ncbi:MULTISPECIES: hypothetical protein [unclassified Chelatococcus]|uniref:hypothetical protein n=1 Tax=unclassified Chelatococcus TaxID=2638111 RepID=UPI001BD0E2D8|nr:MULTISPECIES: hypothetical protein [unclassified Chelatococcus]MBS7700395.1 hypothetical protein [Chelatococcus sp. YT9]MBX3556191.1 hypothetical protein [Chelatococcus sp.]
MGSDPKAIIIAWYSRKDYQDVRSMGQNGRGLPPTFDEWHRKAMDEMRELVGRGLSVERVPVLSWELARWLRATGAENSNQAIGRYVADIVAAKKSV